MIQYLLSLIKKMNEPFKFEVTWIYFFRNSIFILMFFFIFYYAENISEFMSASFGDSKKYLPANEKRKMARMILVSIVCFIGAIPTLDVFYKLVFKKPKK